MEIKKNKFVIIDAMALAYKAYFAFISRPLKSKSGEPTSAVFGFVNQLIKILEDVKPDYIAVAFDSHEKTFRHEKFPDYKSTRAQMPDDMVPQIDRIKEVIRLFNIPIYILPGYEADDIIGTAVRFAEEKGFQSFMITPDKDFMQLVTENVSIIKPGKSSDEIDIITRKKAEDDLGFPPELMADYLGIVGDKSDFIPGVYRVGEKKAVPLIQKFGSIENIYENINEVTPDSLRNQLVAEKGKAFLSKELATISKDVPLNFDFEKTKLTKPNFNGLKVLFDTLNFKYHYERIKKLFLEPVPAVQMQIPDEEPGTPGQFLKSEVSYKLINTVDEAEKLAELLSTKEYFVFDTETDSLNIFEVNLAGVSFSFKEKEAYFVAVNPYPESQGLFAKDLSDRIPVDRFKHFFKPVFENENIKKICQNGKYDIAVMKSCGINVKGFYFDTMIASYVIDPDQKHGMDELAQKYLNYKPIPLSDLIGTKKQPERIFDVELQKLSEYSCEDADITLRLFNTLKPEIEKNKQERLAYEIEFPLVEVLEDMERTGIRIDKQILGQTSRDLQVLMDDFTKNIYQIAGEQFNINSPQQLQKILYEKLKLKTSKKTKTGYSTDAQALESLRGDHEIIEYIIGYRTVSKLKSTYADALPNLIVPSTGRVHTSFNQTVASTGRLSSNEPNLQNIPIRTDLGKEIRKAFVARNNDYLILSADYSQIELRIMASICMDEGLLAAFNKGEDIHRSTAALVFGVKPKDVTPDMRRKAKEVNFGILYGIGAFGLKTRLGIEQYAAKEIIDTYFKTFTKVKAYMENSIQNAREKGYAETLTGRRRYMRNLNSNAFAVRQFEERAAINMPIQGTAADMIKIAMNKIFYELNKRKLKSKMVLQVHDELLFDVYKPELDDVRPIVIELMEKALPLNVPVVVDTGIGDNWLDAH
ncbi:MAG TPA: DNA polymerase I [Ignavibacteriaceae bacterium]|nr:DNA polymerase I [Ignavibacteriaceae bacterium]